MLKKMLLASISLISLNPIQATQSQNVAQNPTHHEPTHREPQNPTHHEPTQHEEKAEHHTPAHLTREAKHCPCSCDGTGGKRAWVLIEAGDSCNKEEAAGPHHNPEPSHKSEPHHTTAEDHHVTPHKPSLHPLPTPEEEKLAEELKPIHARMFRRADPNNPQAEKRGESGKALHGKVYFQHLGIWKHDPSVHPTQDIISTGVGDRIRMLNEKAAKEKEPEKPASAEATKHHPVNLPDALGTTEGRVQSVHTNVTSEGRDREKEREFGLGAPNRAQTKVTGKEIPEADTSETKRTVPLLPSSLPNVKADGR